MNIKLTKPYARAGLFALAGVMLLVVIFTAGGIPPESMAAAEGRGFAVINFMSPTIVGPYTYPGGGIPADGIKVLDIDFSVTANINSDDPNDPLSIRPEFSEVTITKEFDKASPDLNYYCAMGQHFGMVSINMIPAGTSPPPYYLITLEDAVITQVASRMVYRSSDSKYTHLETVSIKCGVIHWDKLGESQRSWDLVHNEAP